MALDVASGWPPASRARTATTRLEDAKRSRVSKPLRGAVPTGARAPALDPASTCQRATPVAPFQLTCTVTLPREREPATAGGVVGVPVLAALCAL